jgi:hypothetical protein
MEAVESLECSREGLLGVWGAERSDSDGGNWGGPPRPGSLRSFGVVGGARYITGGPGKGAACRVGVGGGRSTG